MNVNIIKKLLKNQRGQATFEVLICIIGLVIIAVAINNSVKIPVNTLHTNTINGIVKITGSGM